MIAQALCPNCGTTLKVYDEACPKCGSHDRNILDEDKGESYESSKLADKDSAGFVRRTVTSRSKRAGHTGHRAEEKLTFDRSSDIETVKTHEVWEETEEGHLVKVHDEKKAFPAKHRKDRLFLFASMPFLQLFHKYK